MSEIVAVPEIQRAIVPSASTVEGIMAIAKIACRSGLSKPKSAEDVFFIMMYGLELGLSPMSALRTIHIINGIPACSGEAMASLVRRSGKGIFEIAGDHKTGITVKGKRLDTGETFTSVWTMERAHQTGNTTKEVWGKFPQQMLQWRAVSEVCKLLFSDVILGLYTVEEMDNGNIPLDERGEIIQSTFSITPVLTEPTVAWYDDSEKRSVFIKTMQGNGFADEAEMLALIAPKTWRDFPTGKEAKAYIMSKRIPAPLAPAVTDTPSAPSIPAPRPTNNVLGNALGGTFVTNGFLYDGTKLTFVSSAGQGAHVFSRNTFMDLAKDVIPDSTLAGVRDIPADPKPYNMDVSFKVVWQMKGNTATVVKIEPVTPPADDIDAFLNRDDVPTPGFDTSPQTNATLENFPW